MSGMTIIVLCLAGSALATSPFRYEDDLSRYIGGADGANPYDSIKYIPLGQDPYDYLSFGADLRERVESSDVQLLGFRYRESDTYDLHRLLVYGDLHVDRFRAFVQLGDEMETGRRPAAVPTDVDRIDLAQGFLDYRIPWEQQSFTLRAGRFEMSFDDGALIGLRDGPNTRQVWEGGRSIYQFASGQADAFAVRPVNVNPGAFDDNLTNGQSLWGLHVDTAPPALAPVALNFFYYGDSMPKVLFYPVPGGEHTSTFGMRARINGGQFDGSAGAMIQTGRFNDRDVLAWSGHLDGGWTFTQTSWRPRVGFRADVLSGGNDARGVVHTFNPLFPNYAFSTEATIEAPANLIQTGVTIDSRPVETFSVQYKAEGLWRYSLNDAFYAAPTFALVKPDGQSRGRYSGSEQQLRASWQLSRFVNFTAAFVHFDPAQFLRISHAVAENFGMAELSLRL
jgi:hypothetical protein